ncbi:hypothetical protein [Cognatilysobacter segetis]|uniref:hypothetical protein n=1 Tax=Cognatilysobacter segetis TaxID=2492394 RepID=UPI00105F6994|nr:hypothetical protein [Lysobacter segetis]
MKRRLTLALVSIALAAPLHAGQPVPKSPPKTPPAQPAPASTTESDEDLRRMEATPAQRRDELRAAARAAADRVDVRIRELQARLDASTERMTAESRRAAEDSLAAVRTQRAHFATQLERLDDRSNTAMSEAKTRIIAAYRDLAGAMQRAWARIQPPGKTAPAPASDRNDVDEDAGDR